jgi:hypothetical protein
MVIDFSHCWSILRQKHIIGEVKDAGSRFVQAVLELDTVVSIPIRRRIRGRRTLRIGEEHMRRTTYLLWRRARKRLQHYIVESSWAEREQRLLFG